MATPLRSRTGWKLSQDLLYTWDQLDGDYASFKAQHSELTTYLLPNAGRFFASDNTGVKRTRSIYDNTPTRALRTLGAGLMAGATSPARPWMRLAANDRELNQQTDVERWLQRATDRVLATVAGSNIYRVLHGCYEDLGGYGTGVFLLTADERTVVHAYPLTCGEYRLAQDFQGNVNVCYRKFQRTAVEVVREFGIDRVSEATRRNVEQGNKHAKVTIVHAIEPRYHRDADKLDDLNMPFLSVYYEEGQTADHILRESGYKRFPVLAPRWSVGGSDVYGYGPGMEAIGDIKSLQHQQLRKAQGIDQQTDPALQVPSNLKEREVQRFPGGITHVDAPGSQSGVRPLFEVRIELDHLLEDIRDIRERIRSSFSADLFLMLAMADSNARMTATEVAERHEEKLIQLGPVLERLQTELLQPLVRIVFEELLERGDLPEPPAELVGAELRVEFLGMLAQAQRAIAVTALERALQITGGVAQAKPEILDNIDADALWNEITDMLGVPASISMPDDMRDKLRSARAAAQNAQAQTALQEQQSKTASNLASAASNGDSTRLSDVISLFSGYDQPAPRAVGV